MVEVVTNLVKVTLFSSNKAGQKRTSLRPADKVSTSSGRANGRIRQVDIRSLTLADAQDLQRNCFPHESPQGVADYVKRSLRFVEQGRAAHLVAVSGGKAVASAQLVCWRNRAEIGSLVVAESLRGRGIGTALIRALSDSAADLGAEQIEIGADRDNKRVLQLYRRLGFTPHKEVRVPGNGAGYDHVVYLVKPVPPGN